MIKNKLKILGAVSILMLGVFSFSVANASVSSVYISPASLDKTVGESFVVAVSVAPNGAKVCAVEGELQLDSLVSCQNIVVGEGVMAQKAPSCSDPSFLLGISGCTTENKKLFTVEVQAKNAGSATVDVTGVDVIGEGMPLPFTLTRGICNISAAATTPPAVPTVPAAPTNTKDNEVIKPAPTCTCGDWGEWQWRLQNDCGRGGCDSSQVLQTRERECDPVSCEIEVENRCVADAYCASAVPVVDGEKTPTQTAATADASGSKTGWLLGGLILLILIGSVYFIKRKKK